jgi:Zn-finger nucleic acid-binding protein
MEGDNRMKCPICSESELAMSDRQGIEIDYCPQCRGVWLDRGELDKIIDRSAAAPDSEPPPAARTAPAYRDERHPPQYDSRQGYGRDGHGYKKKKNFLGELFDFD